MTRPMDRSWLVQRLKKPRPGQGLDSGPFAFGGGLVNGGLREEALELFKDLWRFDYMGAAEFEFGEVPRALQRMAKSERLVATSFEVDVNDVQPHWEELPRGARGDNRNKWPRTDEVRTVWVLCPAGWEAPRRPWSPC